MKEKALFFLASTANAGLTSHFSRQIVDMYQLGKQLGWDTFCVSDEKEQNVGIWDFVINNIPSENIIKFDELNYYVLSKKLISYIDQYKEVVIHFQGFTQLWHLRSLLNDHTRGVITIHSFPKRPLLKKYLKGSIYALLAKIYVQKVIFLSPFAMRGFVLSSWLGKHNKIVHIPFSLPIDGKFEDSEIIETKGFNVIYLANFLENKGHERYFVSMKKFAEEHTDVNFWFFGDGPRKNAILKLIENAHMEKQMHCPGRVERKYVPSLIKKSQLAMVLSRTENAGHAFIEPIMYGCPVVGTRVGSAEYLIQDYITSKGINNAKSLFEALQFAYNNQEEMKREALRLQKIINSLYDYQEMIKAYYMLYSEIIK